MSAAATLTPTRPLGGTTPGRVVPGSVASAAMPPAPRVLIAHPDALARDLLRLVCTGQGIHVVGEAASAADLLALCDDESPVVVLSAGRLADVSVEECIDALLATGTRLVVMADDLSPERVTALLERGAAGYLLHDTPPEQVADAIVSVAGGDAALHPAAAVTILRQWRALRGGHANGTGLAPRSTLTAREHEVLVAMAEGMATKTIARHLGVAVKTVENHKIRVFDKLGVRTQAPAVSVAIGQGLLTSARGTATTAAAAHTAPGDD